jgi:hypothetical protein
MDLASLPYIPSTFFGMPIWYAYVSWSIFLVVSSALYITCTFVACVLQPCNDNVSIILQVLPQTRIPSVNLVLRVQNSYSGDCVLGYDL